MKALPKSGVGGHRATKMVGSVTVEDGKSMEMGHRNSVENIQVNIYESLGLELWETLAIFDVGIGTASVFFPWGVGFRCG